MLDKILVAIVAIYLTASIRGIGGNKEGSAGAGGLS